MLRRCLVVATCSLVASVALPGCGGECGEGTVRYGDTCVLVDPFDKTPPVITVDPPLYTREVGTVHMTSNKPATIYYTLDGTPPTTDSASGLDQVVIASVPDDAQLRYFAIDLAGNRSAEQVRIWIIDRDGPPAPTDFSLTVAGASRTVTWTPASDPRPGGVIVARIEGRMTVAPTPGQSYAVGEMLSPVMTIVATSGADVITPSTFSETASTGPGLIRYVAWGFDDLYNYGPPAGAYQLVPMATQTATVTAHAGTGVVDVASAPANLGLTGTASLNGSTLSVKLAIHNTTTRVLFAPKILLTAPPGGVTFANSDGTLSTFPYRAYGAAIAPGGTASATWNFTGASAGINATLGLELRDGRVFMGSMSSRDTAGTVVDPATGAALLTLGAPTTGQGGNSTTKRGAITPDGRVIVASKNAGEVGSFDLVTGHRFASTTLRPQKSSVAQLVVDRSGSAVYALVADGHRNTNGSPTELVRLDATTLAVSGRIDLGISRNRSLELSPDGKTLLIATALTGQGALVVDLPSFAIKQRLQPPFRAQIALFSLDGNSIVLVGEQIGVYSLEGTPGAKFATPGTNGKVQRAAFSDANKLWVGRRGETVTVDLGSGATQEFTTIAGQMLEVFDGVVYVGTRGGSVSQLDANGVVQSTLSSFVSLKAHWIGRSPF